MNGNVSSNGWHRLLQRQLQHHSLNLAVIPPDVIQLIETVNKTYKQYDLQLDSSNGVRAEAQQELLATLNGSRPTSPEHMIGPVACIGSATAAANGKNGHNDQHANDGIELPVSNGNGHNGNGNGHNGKHALQVSEETDPWLRAIFNSLDEAVVVLDQKLFIANVNEAAEKLFQYSREELCGNDVSLAFTSKTAFQQLRLTLQHQLLSSESVTHRIMLKRRDGSEFPAENTVSRLRDKQGKALGVVCVITDLTEASRQERIRNIASNISEAALLLDGVEELCEHIHKQIGTLLDARNFFVALYHPKRGTYTLPYIVDQFDNEAFADIGEIRMEHSMTDYVRRTGEPQLVDPDRWETLEQAGEIRLIGTQSYHWMGVPLRSREGVTGVVVAQTYDEAQRYTDEHFDLMIRVSEQIGHAVERKRAEQNLRESEHKNRTLIHAIPDLIVVIDENGITRQCDASSAYKLRKDKEEYLNKPIVEVLPPEVSSRTISHLKSALATGETQSYEYSLNEDEENEGFFDVRMVPYINNQVLMLIRDITSQKRAEREKQNIENRMQHAQKLESLGVLAGGIAHDFNNLLVGIMGNANLALTRMSEEDDERQLVENIQTAAMRAADLTRQMLAYSGKGSFIIEPLDLSQAIEEMAHLLEVSISKQCELKYDFGDKVPMVQGDATQIRQVVMNLITNASDAIGDNPGRITVRTGTTIVTEESVRGIYLNSDLEVGSYSFVEISDTGAGMSQETIDKMFDPFFTTKFTGRGLGLAAVLGIIRSHGGAIKVYSEFGKGTTIRVLLPASGEEQTEELNDLSTSEAVFDGPATVLVVDDDETVRQVAQMMLEGQGFTVYTAEDGQDGIDVYREHGDEISLVILDMTMPRMDGEQAFQHLQELDPNVRVVLSSGYNEQETMSHFNGEGLAGFIQKPYQMHELIGRVREALEKQTDG
ncbi:PAS domain S-box protein [bacterium]|nr:PAS domain S-box protein [bacterium]